MSQIVLFCEGDGDHRDRHVLTHSCPTLRSSDLLVITLTASIFALGGFINAVFARNFDDISIIPTFVLTPLTYLGGVFYRSEEHTSELQSLMRLSYAVFCLTKKTSPSPTLHSSPSNP